MGATITTGGASGAGDGGTGVPLSDAILEVYSREIIFQAQPLLRYESVTTRKEELGTLPGQTINFLKYASLSGSADLTENNHMVPTNISASQIQVSVAERGRAVSVTEYLLRTSFDDVLQSAATLLGQHMARERDGLIRDALLGAGNVRYAQSRSARTAIQAGDYFDAALVKDMVEFLATRKAPKFGGDAYICFVHPHQTRGLRDDSAWINASNYAAPGQILAGEIGRYEDVRFIETTQQPYILSTDGSIWIDNTDTEEDDASYSTAADVYQAIMVGDHNSGLAVALEAEMRDNGVVDYGREHQLAYYGIWGVDLIESDHVVVGESA